MREMQPFTIWGAEATLAQVRGGVFAVVDEARCPRIAVAPGERLDTGLGFAILPFTVPGKVPLYMEPTNEGELALGVEGETTVGLEIEGDGVRAYYIPSCAGVTDALRARLDGADLMFFDGTTFEDDEMIREGLSPKTAWRMGHMAMNGARGSIEQLAGVDVARKVFIHVNNSNPALCRDSPQRAHVEAAGWRVASSWCGPGPGPRTRSMRCSSAGCRANRRALTCSGSRAATGSRAWSCRSRNASLSTPGSVRSSS